MDNVLLKCNFCIQGGYDAGVLIIPTALKVLQSIMKCLSWEPTYQLGPMAINTNTEGEEFPHFWYIYFQHCRRYWCASIMLTAPLKVQWRKACTTKGTITKGSRLMQLLSSLPGLVSLSSSSKSWRSLLWSLNPPLCDSSVAKLSANTFFFIYSSLQKQPCPCCISSWNIHGVHLTGRNVWIMYCIVNSDGVSNFQFVWEEEKSKLCMFLRV